LPALSRNRSILAPASSNAFSSGSRSAPNSVMMLSSAIALGLLSLLGEVVNVRLRCRCEGSSIAAHYVIQSLGRSPRYAEREPVHSFSVVAHPLHHVQAFSRAFNLSPCIFQPILSSAKPSAEVI